MRTQAGLVFFLLSKTLLDAIKSKNARPYGATQGSILSMATRNRIINRIKPLPCARLWVQRTRTTAVFPSPSLAALKRLYLPYLLLIHSAPSHHYEIHRLRFRSPPCHRVHRCPSCRRRRQATHYRARRGRVLAYGVHSSRQVGYARELSIRNRC
jgi:hypothetical protein